jgi:hypothetical protein
MGSSTRSPDPPTMPAARAPPAEDLARGRPLPGHPRHPAADLPAEDQDAGAAASRRRQVRPGRCRPRIKALSLLRHTQGEWAGQSLRPDPWQVAYIVAPVFGWVRKNEHGDYVRIIRKLYVDIPRKNGKTTIAGGFAIILTAADGEAGAQVYAVAASERQAGYCFEPVKQLATKTPALKGHLKAYAKRIVHPRSGSYFAVVSSAADLIHGANVHGAVVDELHVHKTPTRSRPSRRAPARGRSRSSSSSPRPTTASPAPCTPAAALRRAAGQARHHRPVDVRRRVGGGRQRRPVRRADLGEGQPRVRDLTDP